MADEIEFEELEGKEINELFEFSEELANLHKIISSPNKDYFNSTLLQKLRERLNENQLEEFRRNSNVGEYERHLHKLLDLNLVIEERVDGKNVYQRTGVGEQAINAMRELEAKIGLDNARKIYEAVLGNNSIEIFLQLYGKKKSFLSSLREKTLEIKYDTNKILRQFKLPRDIDAIATVDKFVETGLLIYDKGYFYLNPTYSHSFYQYLKRLNDISKNSKKEQAFLKQK